MAPLKKTSSDTSSVEAEDQSFEIEQFINDSLRSLPNQESSALIVEHYFKNLDAMWPDMGRDEFKQQFTPFWATYGIKFDVTAIQQRDVFDDIVWFAVYAGIMNSTLQLAPRSLRVRVYHPSLGIAEMQEKASVMAARARGSPQFRKSPNVLWRLWALMLAVGAQKNSGRAYIAQEIAQEAMRLALRHDFHLDTRPSHGVISNEQWKSIDQREQLWSILNAMDRHLSFLLNRTFMTKDLTITTRTPRNVMVQGGEEMPEDILTKMTHYRINDRLCSILGMIEETLAACQSLSNPSQKQILWASIDAELEGFEAGLPYAYAVENVGKVIDDASTQLIKNELAYSRQMILVYYLETVMRLHRDSLANTKSLVPDASCIKSIDAALRLIIIQTKFISQTLEENDDHVLAWFVHSFFLYDPAMTLLLALLMFPTHPSTPLWCHAVDDADKLLYQMSQLNISAHAGRNVLRVFKKQAARKLFVCGKGWQGNSSLVSMADVDDINDAMCNTTIEKEQIVPFDYLGITVNWGLYKENELDADVIPDTQTDTSSSEQVSPLDYDDFMNFEMSMNPLDLLQADYMTNS